MLEFTKLLDKLVASLSAWVEGFVVLLPNIALATLVVILAAFGARAAQNVVLGLLLRLTNNRPISKLLATAARVGVIAVALFFALGLLKLDKTVTSLLAGVGVVGLALGFAFQDIAANFMSGFLMAVHGPFDEGDLVEVAGHRGKIKHIALRASEIETLDGLSVLVPNRQIFQNPIVNYTSTPSRRLDLNLGASYGDDMERVRAVILGAVQEVPARNREREVELFFEEFGDSAIKLSVRIWLERSDELSYKHARSEAMIAIKRALDRERLKIPFPVRTLDFGANEVGGHSFEALAPRNPS
jgi:small conductance mechanosensitive channel